MVGGLLVSQVLTLFTTPVIYLFFDRLRPRACAAAAARAPLGANGGDAHEPLRAVHRAPGRDHAAQPRRCVLVGALAYTLLPVSPLPQVDFPAISVSASLPGASPETMASTVATPLERALGTHRRRQRDHLAELAGVDAHQHAVRPRTATSTRAAREVQAAINARASLLPSALPGNADVPQDQSARRRRSWCWR